MPTPTTSSPTTGDRLISIDEAARLMGISRRSVYRHRHTPGFPTPRKKPGIRRTFMAYRDVANFIARTRRID